VSTSSWQPITDHIEARYEDFLNAESRVHRSVQPDMRVHCCLYFISPNGHGYVISILYVRFLEQWYSLYKYYFISLLVLHVHASISYCCCCYHCCLFLFVYNCNSYIIRVLFCFISLKPLDIEFMRRLHDKVNIIPLIAKADTMTPQECRDFKKTVSWHKIQILHYSTLLVMHCLSLFMTSEQFK